MNEELEALIALVVVWVRQNPDAVAGDAAGEKLLDLVRSIALVAERERPA